MTEAARAPAHDTLIQESWSRCRDYGLTHQSSPCFDPPSAGELSALLESRQALVQTTHQEVLPYYGTILSNSNCLIMLADEQGRLLQSWGDQRFIEPRQAAGFVAGASWLERYTGTNAIGTALSCGQAVHIQHDEHFLKANRFMTGSASPIFDEQRRLIAVLDVSSDSYLPPTHTLGMVKMMSQSIENRLILKLFAEQHHLLSFNTSLDNLDSPWAGMVVFDEQGRVVSANRRADSLLGRALVYESLEQIFDLPLQKLLSQPDDQPFSLRSCAHVRFHARTRRPSRPPVPQLHNSLPPTTAGTATAPRLHTLSLGDARMDKAIRQAEKVLEKDIPILIQGETGAGKEVFVKALHQISSRASQPLIAVNCAAIPAELVESELFGYEKGAFTGASQKGHVGLIRKAHKGILFLDEIGDMPLRVQARLLRVLQERCVQPLGSSELHPVDVRLVSATNRPLRQDVDSGQFRADLYYRVSGLNLELPPLRERSDKQALFQRLWEQHREPQQRAGISREVLELFQHHPWPGNLRQLSSVLRVALAMADDQPIRAEHLPDDFFVDLPMDAAVQAPAETDDSDLASQYQACGGNVSHLARHLGLSRNTLYKRLREQGIKH
jgi:transcriptional regulator of acetoin/glycerol metabolism